MKLAVCAKTNTFPEMENVTRIWAKTPNEAITKAEADYLWFADSTKTVDETAVDELVQRLEKAETKSDVYSANLTETLAGDNITFPLFTALRSFDGVSNAIFRREFLVEHNIRFTEHGFDFLLQCAAFAEAAEPMGRGICTVSVPEGYSLELEDLQKLYMSEAERMGEWCRFFRERDARVWRELEEFRRAMEKSCKEVEGRVKSELTKR